MMTTTRTTRPAWKTGRPVAPVRVPFRPAFGSGILPSIPSHRLPVTISDMAWWGQESARAEARDLEQRAGEWDAANRLEAGGIL